MEIQEFLDRFRSRLNTGQKRLLILMEAKVYGFKLESLERIGSGSMHNGEDFEAIFIFEHEGVKGKITINF